MDGFFDLTVKDLDRAWRLAEDDSQVDRRLIARALGSDFVSVLDLSLRESRVARAMLLAAMTPYKHRVESSLDDRERRIWTVYRCHCPTCACGQCGLAIGCDSCECAEEVLGRFFEPTYRQMEAAYETHPATRQMRYNQVALVANCLLDGQDDFGDWELRRYSTVHSAIEGCGDVSPLLQSLRPTWSASDLPSPGTAS